MAEAPVQQFGRITPLVTAIGTLTVTVFALRLLSFLNLQLRPSQLEARYLRVRKDSSNNGAASWALVTGASAGIGLGFARELASKGFNVVLHGRNEEKLQKVKAGLLEKYPGRLFRIVLADAGQSHGMKQAVEGIVKSLDDLPGPLTVLVNNVGGTDSPNDPKLGFKKFDEDTSASDVDMILNLNSRFTTQLTRALIPLLSQNQPSLILNVSSILGMVPGPYGSTYGGSKAYLTAWSTGLYRELQRECKDIECMALIVARTTDVNYSQGETGFFTPRSGGVAKASLKCVGCGRPAVAPHWMHAVQIFLISLLPEPLLTWTVNREVGMLYDNLSKDK